MKRVFGIIAGLNTVLRHVVGAMLGVMVITVSIQICVRFVLPKMGIIVAAPWTEELARYLMVWCIFLGAAVASRSGALIAMDSVVDALPPALGDATRTLGLLITIAFFALLVWLGVRWVEFGMVETSTVMAVPMGWVYAAMPAGSVVAIVNILALMVERHFQRRSERRAAQAAAEEAAASIV
ncbi:MAG: TRAP transporter small permease [Pseudomonadota bacterium]